MKEFKEIYVSENLEKLASKLKNKAELFIVGGYVRNSLIGIGDTDIDICSKLKVEDLKTLLEGTNFCIKEKNKELGTAIISVGDESYEYSTFRTETYDNSGKHSPVAICFVDDIRQDAKRRDFTVNAIYYSLTRKKLIDIYSGLYDLKKRRIKTIETPEYVFSSDGLRILRMIRIACELDFKIEKETCKFAKQMSYKLNDITGARKQNELVQILNAENKYSISKHNAHIRALKYFNSFDLWSSFNLPKSKVKLDMIKKSKIDLFCALFIDIVNTIQPENNEYFLKYILSSLMIKQKEQEYIIKVVCGYFDALKKLGNKEYFFKYFDYFEEIGKFLTNKSIFLFNRYNFFFKYIKNYNLPILVKDLKVNGDDIKKARPKLKQEKYGELLNYLLSEVFDGKLKNTKEDLIKEIKNYDN